MSVEQKPAETSPAVAPELYLLVTMAFFGSAFASSKYIVGEMPHAVAAALRFGGGAILLAVIAIALGSRAGSLSRRDVARCGAVGMLGVFAYNVFFFWGLSYAPSIDGTIIVPVLSPILTIAALILTRHETVSRARVAGLLVGLSGAVVFFLGASGSAGPGDARLVGDLIFFTGAICWAAYSILSKRVLVGVEPLTATAVGTGIGGLALVLVALPNMAEVDWTSLSGTTWWNVVYLMVGPTAIAYLFYFRGLRSVSPSVATIMMFFVPVFGVVCSSVFLGETFDMVQGFGALTMVCGAVLAVTQGVLPSFGRAPVQSNAAASASR